MFKSKFLNYFFIVMFLGSLAVLSGCSDDDDDDRIQNQTSAADIKAAEQKIAADLKKARDEGHDEGHGHEKTTDEAVHAEHDLTHDPVHDAQHVAIGIAERALEQAIFEQEVAEGLVSDAKVVESDAIDEAAKADTAQKAAENKRTGAKSLFDAAKGVDPDDPNLEGLQRLLDDAEDALTAADEELLDANGAETLANAGVVFAESAKRSADKAVTAAQNALNQLRQL